MEMALSQPIQKGQQVLSTSSWGKKTPTFWFTLPALKSLEQEQGKLISNIQT